MQLCDSFFLVVVRMWTAISILAQRLGGIAAVSGPCRLGPRCRSVGFPAESRAATAIEPQAPVPSHFGTAVISISYLRHFPFLPFISFFHFSSSISLVPFLFLVHFISLPIHPPISFRWRFPSTHVRRPAGRWEWTPGGGSWARCWGSI